MTGIRYRLHEKTVVAGLASMRETIGSTAAAGLGFATAQNLGNP